MLNETYEITEAVGGSILTWTSAAADLVSFIFLDGTPVKSHKDWALRRAEMKAMVLHYQFGHAPAPPAPSMIDYDNSPVVIGSDLSFGNLELAVNGVVDEPAIWDRALSQAEIHAIYAAGSAGKPSCVTDSPPIADAGVDFPVNEGQTSVMPLTLINCPQKISQNWRG